MWIANSTRPDIANAVREVASSSHDPSEKHWKAVLRIIQYLKDTRSKGIAYSKSSPRKLVAYADFNVAGNKQDRRSVSGGAVLYAGGVLSWLSKTRHCVTLSTTESKYVALADLVKDLLFLVRLLEFIQPGKLERPIKVFEDNDGALKLASNPICTNRTKRIDVKCRFNREKVEEGVIEVVHLDSENQSADGPTKNFPEESLVRHRRTFLNE